jgi:hypothetical protein
VQIAPDWWVFVRGFVPADDRLNVTDLFDAAVSASQNPVSRKQRPTVAETRSKMGCLEQQMDAAES